MCLRRACVHYVGNSVVADMHCCLPLSPGSLLDQIDRVSAGLAKNPAQYLRIDRILFDYQNNILSIRIQVVSPTFISAFVLQSGGTTWVSAPPLDHCPFAPHIHTFTCVRVHPSFRLP